MEEFEHKLLRSAPRSTTPIEQYFNDSSDTEATFKFICPCRICFKQSNDAYKTSKLNLKETLKGTKNLKGFSWLLEKLSDVSNENPVRINTPDIALFKSGKVESFIQTTREKTLKRYKSYDKLKLQEMIKAICSASKTRKREEISNNRLMLSVSNIDVAKETACLRYMAGSSTNETENFGCFEEDGAVRVMSESEFLGLLWQRRSSQIWKKLAYIQSVLKCKNGIGESVVHSYVFDESQKLPDIESDFSDEEEYSLYLENPAKFCESVFLRIFAYLDKFLGIQLKSISGEFVKDENNRIWLVHASFISFSETGKVLVKAAAPKPETSFFETEVREDLIRHLEASSSQPKNSRTQKLSQFMKEECDKIIQAVKFVDFFSSTRVDKNLLARQKLRFSTSLKKREVKRCASDQKKLNASKHSNNDTKSSSPAKPNSWVLVPKLKFSPIKSGRLGFSRSPISIHKAIL